VSGSASWSSSGERRRSDPRIETPIALVPGVLALLPEYASLEDPVPDLREACVTAVAGLGPRVRVIASAMSGARIGASLVLAVGSELVTAGETGTLVVGNGSAMRGEQAPGHLDERAEAFDAGLREALVAPYPDVLCRIDVDLADELWADVDALVELGGLLTREHRAEVLYDAAPFGVQYWVIRWSAQDPGAPPPAGPH